MSVQRREQIGGARLEKWGGFGLDWRLLRGKQVPHKVKSEASQKAARLLHSDEVTGRIKRLLDRLQDI